MLGGKLLRTSIPSPQNNPAIFNDLNILGLQNSFPKYSAVSGSYVFPPKKFIFLFHKFAFCHRILCLCQLFSISVMSAWLQGKCGKKRFFVFCFCFLISSPCHWQQILTWRCSWNPVVIGWILADVKTGGAIIFHFNLVLWSSEP